MPIWVAMPAGGAAVLTSNDQLSRGGNAPLPVVSDSCSVFATVCTLVIRWCWTSVSPRQDREKEPKSKSRSQADRSPVCFGISVVNASLQSVARWECVGGCRLWTQNVSEAGIAPARGPRDLRRKNRKLWRPTDAKIMCEQSAIPSSSDMG